MKRFTFVDYATLAYMGLADLLILLFHNDTVPQWGRLVVAHTLGLGVIWSIVQLHGRFPGNKALDIARHFYPIACYLWFFGETGWLNRMFFPEYMDPIAIRCDQLIFGFQPSVVFMHKLPYLLVSEVFYAAYFSYYVMIFGVGLALYIRDRRQFFHYLSVISFVFYLCYLAYVILPIIGPHVFFHEIPGYSLPLEYQQLAVTDTYPDAIKSGLFFNIMGWIYKVFEAPGAALPSSHVAIAVCTVAFSFKYLRRIRFVHFVAAILLCLATIYCRYHYAIDVLTGLATAALLLPLGNWLYRKWGESVPTVGAAGEIRPQREDG